MNTYGILLKIKTENGMDCREIEIETGEAKTSDEDVRFYFGDVLMASFRLDDIYGFYQKFPCRESKITLSEPEVLKKIRKGEVKKPVTYDEVKRALESKEAQEFSKSINNFLNKELKRRMESIKIREEQKDERDK